MHHTVWAWPWLWPYPWSCPLSLSCGGRGCDYCRACGSGLDRGGRGRGCGRGRGQGRCCGRSVVGVDGYFQKLSLNLN